MAYRFQSYIELGEAIKQAKPEYKDRDSESLGLRFAERYGDQYRVRVDEEEDRATFAYDPEEGFNILKTLGNLPSSAGAIAEDVATAVMNPLDTAEALGRGVAGAAELALGTDVSPENKRVAEQLGQGLAASAGFDKVGDEYEFTGRGIQERPLDILGMLAGGASVGAKGAALGAKAVGRGARAAGAADTASRAGRVAGAAERVGATAQAFDPAVALPRAAVGATKGAVKGAGRLAVGAGKAVGRKAAAPFKGTYESIEKTVKDLPFAESLRNMAQGASDAADGPLNKIRDFAQKAKESAKTAKDTGLREAEKTFDQPVSGKGIFRGLLENAFGFTWNTGPKLVGEMFNIAESDPAGRKAMLEAIRQADEVVDGRTVDGDAVVARRILSKVSEAAKNYYDNSMEIHKELREPLQLDRIVVPVVDYRDRIVKTLPKGISITQDGFAFDPLFSETGKQAVMEVLGKLYDSKIGNGVISLERLDQVKQLIRQKLYEGTLDSSTDAAKALRSMYAETRKYIGEVADNPDVMNAQLAKLREEEVNKFLNQQALTGGGMQGMIPESLLQKIADENVAELVGVGVGEYSAAMRQYFNFEDFMGRLLDDLRLKNPEKRTMQKIDDEGKPVIGEGGLPETEELLRQPGKEREVLRAVSNVFDDEAGLSLETLKELSEKTNNPTLIAEVIGFNLRPTIAGGLAPRGEIGQAARSAAGGIAHPLAMVGLALEIPPTIAFFSPKYGAQVMARIYSPEGRAAIDTYFNRGKAFFRDGKNRATDAYRQAQGLAAEALKKRPESVSPSEVADFMDDFATASDEVAKLPPRQQSTLQTLLQGGTLTQRAQEQGEQAQQRNNILSRLGRTQGEQ
tara:strand:+ start:2468 stop:5038 length:2571 start_codon:yes stop_codon:yes gene_type:complete